MTLRQHSNATHGRPPEHQQSRADIQNKCVIVVITQGEDGRGTQGKDAVERKLEGKRPLPRSKLKLDLKCTMKNTAAA